MTRIKLAEMAIFLASAMFAMMGQRSSSADEVASSRDVVVSEGVVVTEDVVYGIIDGVELKLDLAVPANGDPAIVGDRPAILVIHGGGWSQGDKSFHRDEIKAIAAEGFIAASIGYRLAPEHIFPAQVDDVRLAVRYLRSRSEQIGFDPDRIGAMGFSAGAHLSMMLATVDENDGFDHVGGLGDYPSDVQAAVAFFGPTDVTVEDIPVPARKILHRFIGGDRESFPEAYRMASPVTHLDPRDAPMLLFHGTLDPLVPYQQALLMGEAMTKNNVGGRVELLIGRSHGWGGGAMKESMKTSMQFFEKHLGAPESAK